MVLQPSDRQLSSAVASARPAWLRVHVQLAFLTNFKCSCNLMGGVYHPLFQEGASWEGCC